MKITIEKNIPVQDALDQIKELLEGVTDGYDILKTNGTLYLTLKNKEGLICPYNEKEYRIGSSSTKNISNDEQWKKKGEEIGKRKILYELRQFTQMIYIEKNHLKHAESCYKRAEKYGYNTAENWKRKSESMKTKAERNRERDHLLFLLYEGLRKGNIQIEWNIIPHEKERDVYLVHGVIHHADKWILFGNYNNSNVPYFKITEEKPGITPEKDDHIAIRDFSQKPNQKDLTHRKY